MLSRAKKKQTRRAELTLVMNILPLYTQHPMSTAWPTPCQTMERTVTRDTGTRGRYREQDLAIGGIQCYQELECTNEVTSHKSKKLL